MKYNDPNEVVVNMDLDFECGIATFKRSQNIPDEFLENLRHVRADKASQFFKSQETMLVCSIPGALIEHWMAEGFNIHDKNVDAKAVTDRLKRDNLTAFLATDKRL